jgi:peptidoglycan-associated lipoprotein
MRITKFCAIVIAFAFALVVIGCHHNTTVAKKPTDTPNIKPASPSATLTVTPDTVDKGQSAQLSWTTQNASTVTIDGVGTVAANGTKRITPDSSTTYHLAASGQGGSTEASARVTVNIPVDRTTRVTDQQLFEQNVKDVFFSYDNYEIRPDELNIVNADAEFLAQHPNIKLVIEGHCDERGSEEYNIALGENRASTVLATLKNHGVSADRVKIISYGKEKPFCTTSETESCWQQNRRAHFAFSE